MAVIEVKNAAGAIVWKSPAVEEPIVEEVENTVRVTEFNTGQVIATYSLKPGEHIAR